MLSAAQMNRLLDEDLDLDPQGRRGQPHLGHAADAGRADRTIGANPRAPVPNHGTREAVLRASAVAPPGPRPAPRPPGD